MIRLAIAFIFVVGIGAFGWHYGTVLDERNHLRVSLKTAQDDLAAAKAEEDRVSVITDAHIQTMEKIVYVDKIINKEIVKYRERVVNRCQLDAKWVRIHDQAASGVPEDPGSGGPDGAVAGSRSSGVDDADALEVTTSNYNKYHVCRAKLMTLQKLIGPYVK